MSRRQLRGNTGDSYSEVKDSSHEDQLNKYENSKPQRLSVWGRFCRNMSFMKYVILILILPPVLNYAALKRESIALVPKHGEKVNMGWGQKLFISCIGTGLPVVILDAPTGGTSDMWYLIQEEVSKFTKVCVYDRAGLGFSELPNMQTNVGQKHQKEHRKLVSQFATLEQMSNDLRHLVTIAKPLARPFLIVGSETGGLIARHYTLTYPEDVSDIVLINPLVEDLFWHQKEEWHAYWNLHLLPSLQSLQLSAFVGISRLAALAGWLKPDITGELVPKEVEFRQFYHLCNPSHMSAVFHEHLLLNTSFLQMSEVWKAKPFPRNVSVTVVNTRRFEKIPTQLYQAWEQSQLHLRQSLHPSCQHFLFDGSINQLYNEPETIVSKVRQLAFKWRLNYDVLTTVHTIQGPQVFPE